MKHEKCKNETMGGFDEKKDNPQYSIIKPDDYGALWNLRIQIAPILKNPFLKQKSNENQIA